MTFGRTFRVRECHRFLQLENIKVLSKLSVCQQLNTHAPGLAPKLFSLRLYIFLEAEVAESNGRTGARAPFI